MNYFNTNNESGHQLKESNLNAMKQEEAILKIFQRCKKLTASECWKIYDFNRKTPLTSVRRAITNLCDYGQLEKTEQMKEGLYGKNEHVYKVIGEVLNVSNKGQVILL